MQNETRQTYSRRDALRFLGATALATVVGVLPRQTLSEPISDSSGEMPTYGGARPGPVVEVSSVEMTPEAVLGEMPTYGGSRPGPVESRLVANPTPVVEALGEMPTYGGSRPGPIEILPTDNTPTS